MPSDIIGVEKSTGKIREQYSRTDYKNDKGLT